MFSFVARNPINLLITRNSRLNATHLLLRFLHKNPVSKPPKESSQNQQPSLTVSYLINSCGLSPQSALSAAKKIDIKTTQNPDSVLNLLKSYGFADTQISKVVYKLPKLLSSNPDSTIRPKLDFCINDIGFSATQLTEFITSCPDLLTRSLERRLKLNTDLLSSIIGRNNQQIANAVRHNSRLLQYNLETNFLPNARILQSYGVPAPNIAKLVTLYPRVVLQATEQFATAVDSIKKLGFDPASTLFFYGISVVLGMTPSTWERKVAVYKSLGWSEGEVVSAFTKYPFCMLISEEKVRRGMDFFVKKMHWEPSFLSEKPSLLSLSLEKRIIPRCSVLSVLASKGLVVRHSSVMFLLISEKDFLNKYVIKYQDQVPNVLQAYNGNLKSVGLKRV